MSDQARDGPAPAAPHRVGRLTFELDGGDEATLLRLRGEVVGGADSWIPAALDAAFSALDLPGRTLRIGRLEVDLGALPKSGFDSARLTEALRCALAERLRDVPDAAHPLPVTEPAQDTLIASFRHFLATGRLPWWSVVDSVAALAFAIAALDVESLRSLARRGADILATLRGAQRLVLQFSPEVAARVAAALPAAKQGDFSAADWPKPADKKAFEMLIARLCRVARASMDVTTQDGDSPQATAVEGTRADASQPEKAARRDTPEEPEVDFVDGDLDIAVADAGLVLLHPFLPALFEARGLAAAGAFLGDSEQLRAIQLVTFLAGGETTREEPQLVMAKLLCGWPLDEPVPRETVLDAVDLAEAAELLRAVVGHWSALGQASPAALRETFLTRPGRLRERGNAWELEVERRGADVLLARLPWTLNPVRLPWMPRPLHVVWS